MIRLWLVGFALAVLWPSAAPAGRHLPVSGGTVSGDHAESRGGLRPAGGFDLSRIGVKTSGADGQSFARKPLRRGPVAPVQTLTVRGLSRHASGVPESAGAHPFFDATAPPIA